MDLFLAIAAGLICFFAILLWIIVFLKFLKTYNKLKSKNLLYCFKDGMVRNNLTVFFYYTSNILF